MKLKKDKRGNFIVPVDRENREYISCLWITARGVKRYGVNHHVNPATGQCVYCAEVLLGPADDKREALQLSERMFEAALSVADEYHRGNANEAELKVVAQAYSLAAAALQGRADEILVDVSDDQPAG